MACQHTNCRTLGLATAAQFVRNENVRSSNWQTLVWSSIVRQQLTLGRGCSAGDATELQLDAGSADVVFSNWLYMYLTDAEVEQLARNALSWVSDNLISTAMLCCSSMSGNKHAQQPSCHDQNLLLTGTHCKAALHLPRISTITDLLQLCCSMSNAQIGTHLARGPGLAPAVGPVVGQAL